MRRLAVLRRAAGPAHRDALVLDERGRRRLPVLVALDTAPWITFAVEGLGITLLVRAVFLAPPAPAAEHVDVWPRCEKSTR